MALQKVVSHDHSITEHGHILVRKITRILEGGKELSKTYHRHVVNPGDDCSGHDNRTQELAVVAHTPEVVAEYVAKEKAKEKMRADLLAARAAKLAAEAA